MKVALRKRNGILEFLGFVDGKGRIRKAKMRKANPVVDIGGGRKRLRISRKSKLWKIPGSSKIFTTN